MCQILSFTTLVFAAVVASSAAEAGGGVNVFQAKQVLVSDERPVADLVLREVVHYGGSQKPGTIIINTSERRLYYVLPDEQAIRYGVGVGRPGFEWGGVKHIASKREWPNWTPPIQMIKRRPATYRVIRQAGPTIRSAPGQCISLARSIASTARMSLTRSVRQCPLAAFA
jgi:lipoprotein-anchoring transpeptidase ErfK/SrfK